MHGVFQGAQEKGLQGRKGLEDMSDSRMKMAALD